MTPDEFKRIRKESNLKQTDLAKKLYKSRREIQNYESGDVSIPWLVEYAMLNHVRKA